MYLLTEWEGRTGKYLAQGHDVRTERQIFSCSARPNSVNKHLIIWPRFSVFFVFFWRRTALFRMYFQGTNDSEKPVKFYLNDGDFKVHKIQFVRV